MEEEEAKAVGEMCYSSDPCDPEDLEALEAKLEEHAMSKKQVVEFWKTKYEEQAHKYWDLFYKRNKTNFFKDRHYLDQEFPQIFEPSPEPKHLLEVGCGVGNTIFPLLRHVPHLHVHGIDFSPRAIQMVREHSLYAMGRCTAHVCDIVKDSFPEQVASGTMDFVMVMFVMSAIHPDHHLVVFKKLFDSLKPGGFLFFRDYGLYDMAQVRLKGESRLGHKFYVRCDGTRTYFFELEELAGIFEGCGGEPLLMTYSRKIIKNRKEKTEMKRVWVQCIVRKPE